MAARRAATGRTETDLRRRNLPPLLRLTLLCFAFAPRCDDLAVLAAIDRWGDLLRAVEADPGPPHPDDAVDAIGWYLLDVTNVRPEDLQMAFSKNLREPRDSILSTAQRLHQEGRAEGRSEGRTEGQAVALLRLLARRFGPLPAHIRARVGDASQSELELWLDRVLDAPRLPDVFAS